ncbi:MAG: FtsW/RodA/SpoVE family cell cycle protein [Saprospiraceae bacterium]|jgi:cell division protein FtsW
MSLSSRIYAELRGDRVIWMIVALLAMFSILAVYSSTGTIAYRHKGGNTEFYLLKQFILIAAGLGLTYLCYLLHYMKYSRAAPVLLAIAIPVLIYTLVFGAEYNEARRWIEVPGIPFTFQTSEFAKLALIIYVARVISSKQEYIKDMKSAFLPIIVPVLIVCGLIAPADLSSAVILFLVSILMMFMGRVAMKYILLLLFMGAVVFSFLVMLGSFFPDFVRVNTWTARVEQFREPAKETYQVKHAKIAIASGDFAGVGPGKSTLRNYLPHPYSDFIYAIICEEYGLLGGLLIVVLYTLLFLRTVSLVTRSPKTFGAMLALGVSLSLVSQAFINMAVSVNLLPVTGVTLPMVSMGGTSILFSSMSFGIVLSVSRYIEKVNERADLPDVREFA